MTVDQLRALRECRFATVVSDHSQAFWIDSDRWRVEAVGFSAFPYERAPGVWDYEGRTGHPDIIAAVLKRNG